MTPKEKADKLVTEMWFQMPSIIDKEVAIECALIAVYEILRSHKNLYGVNSKTTKFYLKVKQEIEKL